MFRLYGKVVVCALVTLFFVGWLDPYADFVNEGNSSYNDQDYESAEKKYDEAENYLPDEKDKSDLAFNRGDVKFKQGKYDEAIEFYKQALNSDNSEIKKKSFYNLGNAYFKKGDNKSAVESYINALKIDPTYGKAKKNLEYMLMKKPEKKDQQNNNKDKNKKDQNNKDQKKNQDKDQNKENKQNKNNKDNKKNNNQSQDKNGEQGNQKKIKLTAEQVKNLLRNMKKKPIRRQKGKNGRRELEQAW